MLGTPLVAVHQTTGQSGVVSATDTIVTWDTVDTDPFGLKSGNTFVLPAGRYQAELQCAMPYAAGGLLRAAYLVDYTSGSLASIGGKVITGDAKPQYGGAVGAGHVLNFSRTFTLTAASTPVVMTCYQDSGSNMTLSAGNFGGVALAINRLP